MSTTDTRTRDGTPAEDAAVPRAQPTATGNEPTRAADPTDADDADDADDAGDDTSTVTDPAAGHTAAAGTRRAAAAAGSAVNDVTTPSAPGTDASTCGDNG